MIFSYHIATKRLTQLNTANQKIATLSEIAAIKEHLGI